MSEAEIAEQNGGPLSGGRKTALLSTETVSQRTLANAIASGRAARSILRSADVVQSGNGSNEIDRSDKERVTLFHIDGPEHRKRRAMVSPYFTLKAIETRYEPIMERTADRLMKQIVANKGARLDKLGFQFAVAVASEVLGLDHADLPALTERIEATINTDPNLTRAVKPESDEAIRAFYELDVLPAIRSRREKPGEDVISRLIDDGASDAFINTEIRSYAFAGMVTTRELIVMCTWYLLDSPDLMEQFRNGERRVQLAIIDEILRLEPIVGYIRRRAVNDLDVEDCGHIAAGTSLTIDVRRANTDEAEVGACPYRIDPDRGGKKAPGSGYMSFGDGPHRCPGAQLGLAEARAFLDRLVRLPGLRLSEEPRLAWFKPIASYVFLEANIVCD